MHATLPLLESGDFPAIRRSRPSTLQVNLGYRCNQQCFHCHVNASPKRKEVMDLSVIGDLLAFIKAQKINRLDLTGGAPELNPHFRHLVRQTVSLGVQVIDRCNLTILNEPGQEDLAEFLAGHGVEVVASLPCYTRDNVDAQRGDGVFESSIRGLRKLNALGYGAGDGALVLNLVYNPLGAFLPPPQQALQDDYKKHLKNEFGVHFNELLTITNMPIKRFGSTLVSKGEFQSYMDLLRGAYNTENLKAVMCRTLISVDYRGYVYDCDFNQMLELPLKWRGKPKTHIRELINEDIDGNAIVVADHCYGCTAGQGSSCGGALS